MAWRTGIAEQEADPAAAPAEEFDADRVWAKDLDGAFAVYRLYPHLAPRRAHGAGGTWGRPKLKLPKKLRGLFKKSRYKVLHGGRGGAKSWSVAQVLLYMAARKTMRILCARELQVSIDDSVHKLLADCIARDPWLAERYDVQRRGIYCTTTGSEFIFSGIQNNVTKVKSMEGIDICWVEEAEKVSDHSWQVIIPTIRKKGSEIWVTFNPDLETDPTSKRFLKHAPPDAWVCKIGWEDNPWFPEELRKEMEYLYSIDPEAAEHVWGGGYRTNSDAQILRGKYVVESFVPEPTWDGPYFGADWGFSTDPSTLIKMYVHENVLYIYEEAYGHRIELDALGAFFDNVTGSKTRPIRADSARPETISYMQRHGYPNVCAADKWPGSVEDGIGFLRSFAKIVIHPRCKHTIEEAKLYSFKVDRLSKQVTTDIVDAHNHCWDAVRYALEPLLRHVKTGMLTYMKQLADSQKPKPT